MADLKNRIRALEQHVTAEDSELFQAVLRYAGEGGVTAAIARLEQERGRPLALSAAFVERAERTAARIAEFVAALDAADGRTPQENA